MVLLLLWLTGVLFSRGCCFNKDESYCTDLEVVDLGSIVWRNASQISTQLIILKSAEQI